MGTLRLQKREFNQQCSFPNKSVFFLVLILDAARIFDKDRTWIGVNEGYSATLECLVRANPFPTVTWYGPGNVALTNKTRPDRMSLVDTITGEEVTGYHIISHLNINPVYAGEDYGTYKCVVSNTLDGIDEHQIHLTRTGKLFSD